MADPGDHDDISRLCISTVKISLLLINFVIYLLLREQLLCPSCFVNVATAKNLIDAQAFIRSFTVLL